MLLIKLLQKSIKRVFTWCRIMAKPDRMIRGFGSFSDLLKTRTLTFRDISNKIVWPSHSRFRRRIYTDDRVVSKLFRNRELFVLFESTIFSVFLIWRFFVSDHVEGIVIASQVNDWKWNFLNDWRVGFPFGGVLIRTVFVGSFGITASRGLFFVLKPDSLSNIDRYVPL